MCIELNIVSNNCLNNNNLSDLIKHTSIQNSNDDYHNWAALKHMGSKQKQGMASIQLLKKSQKILSGFN